MIKIDPKTGKRPKMPIGIQTFDKIREGDEWAYVDKTALVYQLANSTTHNFLSRPRRFGKSLLVSTLAAYFSGKKELFDGLAMEKLEPSREEGGWTPHPVIVFDFVNAKVDGQLENVEKHIDSKLSALEEIWGKDSTELTTGLRFAGIIKRACEKTGQRVVLLFDEYDAFLTQTLNDPELNERVKNALKPVFSAVKGSDQYLRFSLLTGITKFSKLSLFSDVNNLKDISMDENFAALCGITQKELEENFEPEINNLADKQGDTYEETLDKLRTEYNGYLFNIDGPSVYNPFSTINVLNDKKYSDYWFESGSPSMLINQLPNLDVGAFKLEDDVRISVDEIQDYRPDEPNPIPLFFQSGYLTIKDYDEYLDSYILGFPNNEVRRGLIRNLYRYYTSLTPRSTSYSFVKFGVDLEDGEISTFIDRLTSYFAAYPYDTTGSYEERDFQGIIYTLFTLLGHVAYVEKRNNLGRADIIVELRNYVYIFELKVNQKGKPEGKIEEGLAQIEEKGYAVPFEKDPEDNRPICKVAIVFDLDNRNIKAWKATENGEIVGVPPSS
jgi:hypothetical protein